MTAVDRKVFVVCRRAADDRRRGKGVGAEVRQYAGDDGRRNTKYRHRMNTKYYRKYGTSTKYDESAVCRYDNYTKNNTRSDKGNTTL